METSDTRSGVIRFGEYEADLRSGELSKRGTRIRLPGKPFEVLALLLEHPGELVTREELRARLWPGDVFVDFENNLNTAVARLREALGDSAEKPRFIETLPRRGYRFIGRPPEIPVSVSPPSRRFKLAVLPLENLSGDPAQEYFSDGMTEEMITQLASLAPERLGVIARTSAMRYKGTRKDIARIGRELGVDYVVEGSVRRADDRLRISAQLIQVSDQTHLWANSFDGGLGDILRVQSEVARAITQQIEVTVSPAGERCFRRAPAVDPEAYDAYIKGLYHFSHFNPSGLNKAIEYFELAIRKDPEYAAANAKLATTHALMGFWGYVPASEAMPKAEKAALAALQVNDTHPDAHGALAWVHWFHYWNLAEAEREFERAVELAPNDPLHHWFLSLFLGSMREDHQRAIAEAELALELDPLSALIQSSAGWVFYWARHYDRTIAQSRKALEMDPNCIPAYYTLGLALLAKSSFDEAIAALVEATHRFGDHVSLGYLGLAYGLAGRRAEAREVLAQLERRAASQKVPPYCFVWVYLGLGENQAALDWIEKAYAAHIPITLWLRCAPTLDPLRSEPRFEQLLARLNLLPRAASHGS
ncbi:MAG: winged helix-turn-helix domain-containing protein [Acidobacteria bacterium]|nr:winged helix-turn-helix domain-containing protein [Acidobacteriota bacterium]